MNRRHFLRFAATGGVTALAASLFVKPTARMWDRAYDYYCRQPYLKRPAPIPTVPGQSTVFQVDDVPAAEFGAAPHAGLDALLRSMAGQGLLLYRSDRVASLAGPEGLIAATDVVLLKVNSQWAERGMTSTDLVGALIERLLDHPDGFRGEVVVVENGQDNDYLDSPNQNNDESADHSRSIKRLVDGFGDHVSLCNWRLIGRTAVQEFEANDSRDGYVLAGNYPVNYPKFTTGRGTRISLKRGVWNGQSYDSAGLKLINLPVLKAHVFMGSTGAVKNYTGVMSRFAGDFQPGDDWDFHANFYRSWGGNPPGLLGVLLAMRFPALTIMDATYVNPRSNWQAGFADTPRVGKLLAGVDPVALDYYASKAILLPLRLSAGDTKAVWSDPDAASVVRHYLLASQARLLEAGYTVRFGPDAVRSVVVSYA